MDLTFWLDCSLISVPSTSIFSTVISIEYNYSDWQWLRNPVLFSWDVVHFFLLVDIQHCRDCPVRWPRPVLSSLGSPHERLMAHCRGDMVSGCIRTALYEYVHEHSFRPNICRCIANPLDSFNLWCLIQSANEVSSISPQYISFISQHEGGWNNVWRWRQ